MEAWRHGEEQVTVFFHEHQSCKNSDDIRWILWYKMDNGIELHA